MSSWTQKKTPDSNLTPPRSAVPGAGDLHRWRDQAPGGELRGEDAEPPKFGPESLLRLKEDWGKTGYVRRAELLGLSLYTVPSLPLR